MTTTEAAPEGMTDWEVPGGGILRIPTDLVGQIDFVKFEQALASPARPRNVIEALAAVMRDLPGIGKDDRNEAQGFNFRGIEAVTRHVQALLGKYGVVFVPRIVATRIEPITVNGKPWSDTFLDIEYDVYGPGGIEDKIVVGPLLGVSRNNADKGASAAMTAAYKYALLQTLCVGDGKDDADASHAEADAYQHPAAELPAPEILLATRIKALPEAGRARIKQMCEDNDFPTKPKDWSDEVLATLAAKVSELEDAITFGDELPDAPTPEASQDATSAPESAPEPQEAPPVPPEAQTATQAPVAVTWDVATLPSERTAKSDLRWVAVAPVAIVGSCGEAVKAMSTAEVLAALEAEDLPTTGNAATCSQRLAMRRIRLAMESHARRCQVENEDVSVDG